MKVSAGTVARTAALAVTIVNSTLTAAGKNPLPFSDNEVYQWVSYIASMVASVVAWWKNNSFTSPAIAADESLKKLKKESD